MLTSDILGKIKEIDEKIRILEDKYGMSYKAFYQHIEGDMSLLLKMFDVDEVMDDLERLIMLLKEKEKLLKEIGKKTNLFSELDEKWVKII